MNRKMKGLIVIAVTLAVVLPPTIVYGLIPILQNILYDGGTIPSAPDLPLGSIFPTTTDSETFQSALLTNDYAGSLTIEFKDVETTWKTVFSDCSIDISLSGGSYVATIDLAFPTTTITVAADQEYDYFIEYTPLETFQAGVNLDLEIS